jgi:hypothetical protein
MRTVTDILSDLSWKRRVLSDSQEHAQIVRIEADIEELNAEYKSVIDHHGKNFEQRVLEACTKAAEAMGADIRKMSWFGKNH